MSSLLAMGMPAWGADVALAGLAGGERAILVIDGQRVSLSKGEKKGGVQLLGVENGAAIVAIEGKERRLRLGERVATMPAASKEALTLTADARGHFHVHGAVNGVSLRFLVDTGATMVALGMRDAQRAGIDPDKGEAGVSLTANGPVAVRKVRLARLTLGGVTLYDVEAVIHEGDLPVSLLGMSALNRFEIRRDGDTMTLIRRF
ncbi:MAG: TIGR02281 family clan AA aspartic protease [Rhodocyclaceae bacterium]|nr:TIGR02281 family clan AA aspartic protease [Rhodocyclaceae bacterium]